MGMTLVPYYTTLTGWQDAHEIVNLDSSLRHIMSMCTDILKESTHKNDEIGWDQAWAELIALRSSCLHQSVLFMQKFLAKRQGVAFMCCVFCLKGAYQVNKTCH